jgi:transposase
MKNTRVKFKTYQQNQLMVLPPTFEEMIPATHPVRVVNQIIEEINLDPLIEKYKGGGCSSYHPRMMLKVLVYGYLCNIYSSRKIEAAIKENIYFMWISGMEQPDHNTINRFRTDRLKGVVKEVFTKVVLLMAESGHVDLQKVYTDGTKIESKANRYTFVWGKNVKRYKENIVKQLEELWNYTQEVAAEELKDNMPITFEQIDPEKVRQTINQIDEALKDKPVSKEIKKKINKAKKDWPENIEQYNKQEEILGERNSYAKTDTDATFMRMKDDHLQNGQLKPAYNAQISTNNQFIVNYTIHQNPGDTNTLIPHLESFKEGYNFLPKELTADAAYGSEGNYEYMEQNNVEAYVKYNYFYKEQKEGEKAKPTFHIDNLYYNKEHNCYYCPMGQRMNFIGTSIDETESGYKRTLSHYQAQNCVDCPLHGPCHKSKNNRIIEVSHRLNELKAKARERLCSETGLAHRSQRSVDVEPTFGIIKQNKGFRRFMLTGNEKVNIEFGLLSIAHNLKKLATKLAFWQILSLLKEIMRFYNAKNYKVLGHFNQILSCCTIKI